ncbi:MAG TPA: ankyrin repeat domain-containing protein [Methylibium sp.]|nr:ankyrin repeat domain-containing protein [Methylibium sp.]
MRFIVYLVIVFGVFSQAHADSVDFFRAVIRDDPVAVRSQIEAGADPNQVDPNGQTALGRALFGEAYGVALELARHPKLDIGRRNQAGETGLMLAALKGREDICRVLLERGAPPDSSSGWTPLHYAAAGNSLPVVKLLLGRGVRVDPRAPNGRTPLMMAAAFAGEEVVDALLAAGADPAAQEPQGHRAADFARGGGRDPLADRLDAAAARRTKDR